MLQFLLSIVAAALYSVAGARLYVALGAHERAGGTRVAARGDATSAGAPTAGGGFDGAGHPGLAGDRSAGPPGGRRRRTTLSIALAALVLHGWLAWHQTGLPEVLRLPFFTALDVVALGIAAALLALCLTRPADYLGLAVYPLAAVAVLASQAVHDPVPVRAQAVEIHVLLSVLAYAVLALAAAQSVLVYVQRRFLAVHRPGGFLNALPPLESTESLLFALLAAGFGLLTLSLVSGFFYLEDMFAQHLVHKTVLSCAAWAVFGALLFGRWRFGWRGRRAVQFTLGGYALLLLAYFGSKLVLELVIGRGT